MTGSREKDLIIMAIAAIAVISILSVFLAFRSGYAQPAISMMYQVQNATDVDLLVDERLLPRDFETANFAPEASWNAEELSLYPAGQSRSVTISARKPLEPQADRFAITALTPDGLEVVFQRIYEFGDLQENGAIITVESDSALQGP